MRLCSKLSEYNGAKTKDRSVAKMFWHQTVLIEFSSVLQTHIDFIKKVMRSLLISKTEAWIVCGFEHYCCDVRCPSLVLIYNLPMQEPNWMIEWGRTLLTKPNWLLCTHPHLHSFRKSNHLLLYCQLFVIEIRKHLRP